MKLSRFGRLQMNNPGRAWAQRRITAKHMVRLGGDASGAEVLEIGCGRGTGVQILLEDFRVAHVDAFDLDPKLVQMAQRRLAMRKTQTRLWVGDATSIEVEDSRYDAIFDFGVIHQIEEWRAALAECARVLKPGGRFFFEAVTSPLYRLPMNLAMERGSPDVRKIGFDRDSFLSELERVGMPVGRNYVQPHTVVTAAFIGDLIGVATRSAPNGSSGLSRKQFG